MIDENEILKCVVVDDEPHAAELLEMYIAKTPFIELIYKETDPWKAVKYLKENKVDLLFLDVQMEGLTGLQVLDILEDRPPVILTTAYQEYALKGYEYKIEDYLLKPYSYDRFLKAVTGISNRKKTVRAVSEQTEKNNDHIFLKGDAKNKFHRIKYDDILYVEGLRNYVQFHCEEEKIITLQNMKNLQELLPNTQFIRVHKSYIINLQKIKSVEGNSVQLGNKDLPIGASYKADFLAKLK